MAALRDITIVAQMIASDAEYDASKRVEFTALGVGTTRGEQLAMIAALAGICEELQSQINDLRRTTKDVS